MSKNAKSILLLTIIFIVLVIALPTVCAFMPYCVPTVSNENVNVFYEDDGKIYVWTDINNESAFEITSYTYSIDLYDVNGRLVFTDYVTVYSGVSAHSSADTVSYLCEGNFDMGYYAIYDFEFEFKVIHSIIYYIIGGGLFGIIEIFFKRQKYVFYVGKHKFEVIASLKSAKISANGKLLKEIHTDRRNTIASATYKISGEILQIHLKHSYFLPHIKITVNGEQPKYTK